MLEILEDRTLPSVTLLWVRTTETPGPDTWSNLNNWTVMARTAAQDPDVGSAASPRDGDSLIFDTNRAVISEQGTAADSTDNVTGLQIKELIVKNYTGTIALNFDLTVNRLEMVGGTISTDAAANLILQRTALTKDIGESTISGGATLAGPGSTIVRPGTGGGVDTMLNIDGPITLDNTSLLVEAQLKDPLDDQSGYKVGIVYWYNGSISVKDSSISVAGVWEIIGDHDMLALGTSSFIVAGNVGRLVKSNDPTVPGAHTWLGVPITVTSIYSEGAIQVNNGILALTEGGSISSKVTVGENAQLAIASAVTMNTGTDISGPGFVRIASAGTIIVPQNNTAKVYALKLQGGTISGAGNLIITKRLEWAYGTMAGGGQAGSGTTTLGPAASAIIGGNDNPNRLSPVLDQRLFDINSEGQEILLQGVVGLVPNAGPITLVMQNNSQINIGAKAKFYIEDNSGISQGAGFQSTLFIDCTF